MYQMKADMKYHLPMMSVLGFIFENFEKSSFQKKFQDFFTEVS